MARTAGFYAAPDVLVLLTLQGALGAPVILPGLVGPAAFPFALNSGRGEDEFVNASLTVDGASLTVGADGEVVANKSSNKSGTLALTVMASALLNLAMTAAYNAQSNELNPVDFFINCTVKDINSPGSLIDARGCVIQRSADVSFGVAEGSRVWTLLASQMQINSGARVF